MHNPTTRKTLQAMKLGKITGPLQFEHDILWEIHKIIFNKLNLIRKFRCREI